MKKSSMVLKFDPYEALMINRGNHNLIVFHQKHASGSIYTAAARIQLSTILIAVIADVASLSCVFTF